MAMATDILFDESNCEGRDWCENWPAFFLTVCFFLKSFSGFVLLFPLPLSPKSVVTPPLAYVAHNTLTLRLLQSWMSTIDWDVLSSGKEFINVILNGAF